MLILAGGGMATAGALVVFGALTGRLAAMMAAVFKPADLSTGYYVRPGAVDPLNTTAPQPGNGGAQPDGLGGFIAGLGSGTAPAGVGYPAVPAPQVAPAPAQQLPPLPGTERATPGTSSSTSLADLLTGGTR